MSLIINHIESIALCFGVLMVVGWSYFYRKGRYDQRTFRWGFGAGTVLIGSAIYSLVSGDDMLLLYACIVAATVGFTTAVTAPGRPS